MTSNISLGPCRQDGAYQYLVIREQKKSFEVTLLHVQVKQKEGKRTEKRMTKVYATVPKSALGFHGLGINASRGPDSLRKTTVEPYRRS